MFILSLLPIRRCRSVDQLKSYQHCGGQISNTPVSPTVGRVQKFVQDVDYAMKVLNLSDNQLIPAE